MDCYTRKCLIAFNYYWSLDFCSETGNYMVINHHKDRDMHTYRHIHKYIDTCTQYRRPYAVWLARSVLPNNTIYHENISFEERPKQNEFKNKKTK